MLYFNICLTQLENHFNYIVQNSVIQLFATRKIIIHQLSGDLFDMRQQISKKRVVQEH